MKKVTMDLINIYKITDVGMLGGKLSEDNPYTFHHIIPVREKGATTVENGAVLTRQKHEQFNQLERMYPEFGEEINKYLYTYRGNYPPEIKERIDYLMSLVDKKNREKARKKQKKISNYKKHRKKHRR